MKKLFFSLLVFAFFSSDIYAINAYSKGDTLHVFATSGLRLRDAPNGKVLAVVPYGAKLVMRQAQPTNGAVTIEKIKGYWAVAEWNGQVGVVFDGFLGWLPVPHEGWEAYCDSNFQLVSKVDSNGRRDSEHHHRYYIHGKCKIAFTDESGFHEIYWSNGSITFSELSQEEIYLLFLAMYRHDNEVGDKITPEQTEYLSDDESSRHSFDARGIYWSWSH